jgi:hypothetical protein
MSDTGNDGNHRYKVSRLIDEYDLDGIGEEMERLWTDDEHASLRSLADLFNRRLLASAASDAGMQPLDGEVENLHRLLTDENEPAVKRTEAVRKLEREAVDVDALRSDFDSYQSIRT